MGHVARKRFGQHFLVDRGILESIAGAIDPRSGQRVVEIGPGLGALTTVLLQRIDRLVAIEIDRDLARALRTRFGDRIELHEGDVLKVDLPAILGPGRARLVGNLPYNISTPLLVRLIAVREQVIDQHFMLQREVAERIVAQSGSSAYGRLGVLLQCWYHIEWLLDVPPQAFDPPPRVDSAVIRMIPRAQTQPFTADLMSELLLVAFGQRRKMLRNTLLPWLERQGVVDSAIDPTARAEELEPAVWQAVASRLASARGEPGPK